MTRLPPDNTTQNLSTDALLEHAKYYQAAGHPIAARVICTTLLYQEWMGVRELSNLQRGMAYAIPSDNDKLLFEFCESFDT